MLSAHGASGLRDAEFSRKRFYWSKEHWSRIAALLSGGRQPVA